MVIVACSLVQHYFGLATATADIVGEGIAEEDIVDEETVDEEVGYEETDFLDGSFSNQETKKFVVLIVVSKVTKSYNYA